MLQVPTRGFVRVRRRRATVRPGKMSGTNRIPGWLPCGDVFRFPVSQVRRRPLSPGHGRKTTVPPQGRRTFGRSQVAKFFGGGRDPTVPRPLVVPVHGTRTDSDGRCPSADHAATSRNSATLPSGLHVGKQDAAIAPEARRRPSGRSQPTAGPRCGFNSRNAWEPRSQGRPFRRLPRSPATVNPGEKATWERHRCARVERRDWSAHDLRGPFRIRTGPGRLSWDVAVRADPGRARSPDSEGGGRDPRSTGVGVELGDARLAGGTVGLPGSRRVRERDHKSGGECRGRRLRRHQSRRRSAAPAGRARMGRCARNAWRSSATSRAPGTSRQFPWRARRQDCFEIARGAEFSGRRGHGFLVQHLGQGGGHGCCSEGGVR